eukprot:NODE_7970_length_430_cov_2.616798_g7110_i0.p2 GENE.NODE_7970_length_430_cov_2.616798_g7110_i0~~NODE_7970_length_430_cov_2.616798_g7110_i0.p2  ORF type:complete len:65 (+),score=8.16 NODE_7970_length_430_cov_2.616798_g7110_i0:193-387(+)
MHSSIMLNLNFFLPKSVVLSPLTKELNTVAQKVVDQQYAELDSLFSEDAQYGSLSCTEDWLEIS